MKIVHLSWSLGIGGIETMLVNIANAQAHQGNDVTIIIINDLVDKSLVKRIGDDVKVIALRRKLGGFSPFPFIKLNILLWQGKYNVIHCHHANLITLLTVNFRNKCCYTQHSVSSQGSPERRQLLKYKIVFAISNAVADYLSETCDIKSIVVRNGINLSEIDKRNFRIPELGKEIKVVTVGRLLTKIKGQDVLLEAMTFLPTYVCLYIIGDGPDKSVLESMVQDLSLSNRVFFLGGISQDDLFHRLKEFDIYVLPSRTEGFGLSVAEAMAAKLPVVVSNIEGPREIVNNGKYGHLFHVEDAVSCAKEIESVIMKYDSEKQLEDAYTYVLNNYSVYQTAREYLNNYKKYVV